MLSTPLIIGFVDENPHWRNNFKRFAKGKFNVYTDYTLNAHTSLDHLAREIINSQVSGLVIDYDLKETDNIPFYGHELAARINELCGQFPMLILTAYKDEIENLVPDNLPVLAKEDMSVRKEAMIEEIGKHITGHYKAFEEARKEIEVLVDKELREGLSPSEEKRYIELDDFLDRFIAPEMKIPSQYKSKKSIIKFRKLADEAEDILRELEKRNAKVSPENSKEKKRK